MLLTSAPLSGFAEVVGDQQKSADTTSTAAQSADYSAGNTQEELRMPIETDSYTEPEVAGEIVEVNQYSKVYKTGERTYSAVYALCNSNIILGLLKQEKLRQLYKKMEKLNLMKCLF